MIWRYPLLYQDANGEEITVLENDGKTLRLTVRGVTFTGSSPDNMEPTIPPDSPALSPFGLIRYPQGGAILWSCALRYDVTLPLLTSEQATVPVSLHVSVEMAFPPGPHVPQDYPVVRLRLPLNGVTYESSGGSGWFEDELLEVQRALPEGYCLKACINCAFSDYSVYGHQTFGDMLCFRNNKEGYLAVRTKREYMNLSPGPIETVQETYLCPEFERRVPGTGYRG
jgi:hypothetical protein